MTASHLLKLQLLTAAALVVLAASCGTSSKAPAPAPPIPEAACDLSDLSGSGTGGRYRAWVLFSVEDPWRAVAVFSQPDDEGFSLLTDGEDDYVIVRADVVEGNKDFNLVIPIDAKDQMTFDAVHKRLTDLLKGTSMVLHVTGHCPAPPHRSNTYIAVSEIDKVKGYYLEEYDPAGRHPNSPGANPWG